MVTSTYLSGVGSRKSVDGFKRSFEIPKHMSRSQIIEWPEIREHPSRLIHTNPEQVITDLSLFQDSWQMKTSFRA